MQISFLGMQMESSVCTIHMELTGFNKEKWRGDMDHTNTEILTFFKVVWKLFSNCLGILFVFEGPLKY